ncbi:hypothetical protein ABEZ21_04110 [Brevibacillus porteri]|uniref:Uncharacterized protein n=1 Tax=Brevibacillus porteri TaxID=2126350 RepID=A0ABX5FHB8_9BACL|nr:hypothetical protein [Brevibacillus porteri]MED2133164.1 hypothetical protein [Brevibacillus porteri]MED2748445.1 hypothetical protein [Brevibacillus porteri]MED2813341.1 hypothetical protein [Brevibacillus porteri]MED4899528.1 hypothetical protein [Brevibacillus porteri]PSK02357.1 hypothetical protein C7R92_30395 [Brevibacillus porteri]
MRKKRPQLRIVAHYMMINGEKVAIDPAKTDLPDRCKLLMAEMITGQMFVLVDRDKGTSGS